jgi:hypothetical protein
MSWRQSCCISLLCEVRRTVSTCQQGTPYLGVVLIIGATSCCGFAGSSLVAMWFDSHIQARRSVAAQGGDKVVVLGPVLSLPLRSQLGSSIDLQTNPSVSGGEATSACHADATPRNLVRPAPCMQQPADRSCTQKAATDRCDSYATLKVKVDDTGISDVAIGSSKGQCAGLDFSPGCDDSRRSSSTMEAPALDSSRAESRACHEV